VYATGPLHGGFAFPIFSFFQSYQIVHFLARARKRTKRKRPCPAFSCASMHRPARAETRFAQTVRTLFPSAAAMLGAGQRGRAAVKLYVIIGLIYLLVPEGTLVAVRETFQLEIWFQGATQRFRHLLRFDYK
jgi:hypothetical protein